MKTVYILLIFWVTGLLNLSAATRNFYVRDFGLKPGTGENAILPLVKAMEECKKIPGAVLNFEPGRYDFTPVPWHTREYFESNTTDNNPKNLAILLDHCKGLTIDGHGAELVFHGAIQPITIDHSENIVVRNLSFDWDNPLTAQGKVLDVSPEHIDLEIDTNQFPYRIEEKRLIFYDTSWKSESRWFMEFEAETHRIAAHTGDEGCVRGKWEDYRVEELKPGVVRLNGTFTRTPAKGNWLVLRHSPRDHAAIFILESSNVVLSNLNLYHSAGLGVLSQFSRNLSFNQVKFIPNAAKNRYLSGHDDGFHVSNCAGLVKIEKCEFGGLMDDPVNIHGTSVKIIEKQDAKTLKCRFMHHQSAGMEWGHLNDSIGFIENTTMETIGTGILKSFKKLTTDEFTVSFEGDIPAAINDGDALENLTWTPSVIIRNTKFGSCRARGLLVSTPGKVRIENNIFESSGAAILIAGDANEWYESGAVHDVTIRGNIFKDACMSSMYQFCEAIISIVPVVPEIDPQKPFHRNIRIEKNTFHPFDYPVLYAFSVDNLSFTKNKIIRSYLYKPFHPRKTGFTIEACKNVVIRGNQFEGKTLSNKIKLEKMDKNEVKTDLEIL